MKQPPSGADITDKFSDPEGLKDRVAQEIVETVWPPAPGASEAAVSYDRRAQTGAVLFFLSIQGVSGSCCQS